MPYPAPPAQRGPVGGPSAGHARVARRPAGTRSSVARPGVPGWRSEGVPIGVAAWVDPAGGPLVAAAGGDLHPDRAQRPRLRCGAAARDGAADRSDRGRSRSRGQWQVSGTTMTFVAPAVLPAGQYPVRLRVADIEADPAQVGGGAMMASSDAAWIEALRERGRGHVRLDAGAVAGPGRHGERARRRSTTS